MSTGITNPGSSESGSGKWTDAEMVSLKILALLCSEVLQGQEFQKS